MVKVGGCSSVVVSGAEDVDPVSSTKEVVVPDCSPAGVVCGRAVWGSPANVVEVSECSSVVVAGAEDESPACSTENSEITYLGVGCGLYGLRIGVQGLGFTVDCLGVRATGARLRF